MIRNEQDAAMVREQLARIEESLAAIEREVRPQSEAWFQLMAEGYLSMINQLRAELATYQSLHLQPSSAAPAIPLHASPVDRG